MKRREASIVRRYRKKTPEITSNLEKLQHKISLKMGMKKIQYMLTVSPTYPMNSGLQGVIFKTFFSPVKHTEHNLCDRSPHLNWQIKKESVMTQPHHWHQEYPGQTSEKKCKKLSAVVLVTGSPSVNRLQEVSVTTDLFWCPLWNPPGVK